MHTGMEIFIIGKVNELCISGDIQNIDNFVEDIHAYYENESEIPLSILKYLRRLNAVRSSQLTSFSGKVTPDTSCDWTEGFYHHSTDQSAAFVSTQ